MSDTTGLALSGYVASGPLVLLLELAQRMGPLPSAGQVYALFALSAAGTLAGADSEKHSHQAVQPLSAQGDPQQCSCARAHATPDVQVSCARHGCGCGAARAAARVACAAYRKYGAARALACAAGGRRFAARRRPAGRGHRAADPRYAPRVLRQRGQRRGRARAQRAAAVRARPGHIAARVRART